MKHLIPVTDCGDCPFSDSGFRVTCWWRTSDGNVIALSASQRMGACSPPTACPLREQNLTVAWVEEEG